MDDWPDASGERSAASAGISMTPATLTFSGVA
jgi:hypothetical protein